MSVPIASVLLFLLALPLSSQAPWPLAPGDVVRWKTTWRRTEAVVLAPVTLDAPIRVRPGGSRMPTELAWTTPGLQVRISKGRRTTGMLRGAGVGAAVGIVLGLASGSDEPGGWFAMSASDKAIGAGFLLALLGAPIGAIAAPGAKWVDVAPRATPTRIGWHAGPGRIGVRLAF